jgi:hypothetical protein
MKPIQWSTPAGQALWELRQEDSRYVVTHGYTANKGWLYIYLNGGVLAWHVPGPELLRSNSSEAKRKDREIRKSKFIRVCRSELSQLLWGFSLSANKFALFFFFLRQVFLCSPGCPGTHSVDQAGLELRNPPASASQVLGLKACATTPGRNLQSQLVDSQDSWVLRSPICTYFPKRT